MSFLKKRFNWLSVKSFSNDLYVGGPLEYVFWPRVALAFMDQFLRPFRGPTFSSLLVEGYFHTRNKRRYLERLLLGALGVDR